MITKFSYKYLSTDIENNKEIFIFGYEVKTNCGVNYKGTISIAKNNKFDYITTKKVVDKVIEDMRRKLKENDFILGGENKWWQ